MNRKKMLLTSGILATSLFTTEKRLFAKALSSNIESKRGFNVYNVAEISETKPNFSLTQVIEFIIKDIDEKASLDKPGGDVIYFPPGVWEIEQTIKIPPRVMLLGMGGFFHQQGIYESNFYKKQHTVIRLKRESNCNIIEPRDFRSSGIQIKGIILDGNKHQQRGNGNYCGIYLPDYGDEENFSDVRLNLSVRDVLIFNCKGDGIYSGKKQNEFRLENVHSAKNDGNGFYFSGTDILLSNVWAGDNGRNGIYINGGGAVSAINCDSWGNKLNGVLLDSYTQNNTFNRLQCNINVQNGVRIKGGVNSTTFLGSVFKENSKVLGGGNTKSFANVGLFSESNNSPRGIKFIGCQFGEGNVLTPATTFGIEDNSERIFPNSIIGCTFAEKEFAIGIVNKNIFKNYSIDNCTAGSFGGETIYNNSPHRFVNINNDYEVLQIDEIISVNTELDNFTILLPSLNEVPIGTEIRIIKQHSSNYYILKPQHQEELQNIIDNKITVEDDAWTSVVVIHANNSWIVTK